MIDYAAIERLGGTGEAAGCLFVALAWGDVSARVVVSEQNPRASVLCRIAYDRPKGKFGARFVAVVAREVETVQLLVEMGDPQPLARGVRFREAAGKKSASGGKSIDLQRRFGTLMLHARTLERPALPNDRNRVGSGPNLLQFGRLSGCCCETTET